MANRARLKAIVPQFVVPNVTTTAEYYRDVLGFEILSYFLDPPVYAMVRRDEIEIHFGKSDIGDIQLNETIRHRLGSDAYIIVSDIDGMHAEFVESGANIVEGLTKRVYGSIEFGILDCDGHCITFGD